MATNLSFSFGADDLLDRIDAETSRHAAFLRFPDGGSAYDALRVHSNDRPTVEAFASDAFRTILSRFGEEGKYTKSSSSHVLSFYLPDYDNDLNSATKDEISRYVVLSATARWLMARSFGEYAKMVAQDCESSLSRIIEMLRTRKSPLYN